MLKDRVDTYLHSLQDSICASIETLDTRAHFREDAWQHESGGGGRTRVLQHGAVFEKAGVNFSSVSGPVSDRLASTMNIQPGATYSAMGVSLVLHPHSPMVPTVHANYRYFELSTGDAWFGGGSDLTPYYLFEHDAKHFHATLRAACDKHTPEFYPRFKKWCDEYFFVKHRGESRGVGGIFFDYLRGTPEELEKTFDFVRECGDAFIPSYAPIVEDRCALPFDEEERHWQLLRRGRYVEFNLVYDRGTLFGLETGGRIESILMSLPSMASWEYDHQPEPGSPEATLVEVLRNPREWV